MDNSSVTLQGSSLLSAQFQLVTPTTVAGTFYGIAFTLFCLYVHSLTPRLQDRDRKRQARFMLAYSIIIMLCGLYSLVSSAWVIQDAYVKHGDYPGGPYLYVISTFHAQPVLIVGISCQLVIEILTLAIQLWRVWIIWSATRFATLVTVLPLLCLLTLLALDLRTITRQTTLSPEEFFQPDDRIQLAEVVIQGTTTIVCTALISLYLVYQHYQQRKLIGEINGSDGYTKIVAMLIESYALESVWILTEAILFEHPLSTFFAHGRPYILIIAYLLVQYRVASGKAYESQRGQRYISSLHWNHSMQATTQLRNTSEAGNNCHVSVRPSTDVLPVSGMA